MSLRLQRVAEQIQQEVSALLLTDAKDARLRRVAITGVRVSPDIQVAHVHYVVIGEATGEVEHTRIGNALERAAGWLRSALGKRLRLRRVPALVFHFDESLERGAHMESVLADLRDQGEMGSDDSS